MTLPQLAVKQSGFGGRGYAIPALPGEESKRVKADGGYVQAQVKNGTALIVPSVTTVLRAGSSDALVQWAVDQTAGYAANG